MAPVFNRNHHYKRNKLCGNWRTASRKQSCDLTERVSIGNERRTSLPRKTASTVQKVTILFCVRETASWKERSAKQSVWLAVVFFWELFHSYSAHPTRTTNNAPLPSPMGCFTLIIKTMTIDASSCHIVWTTCQSSGQVCLFKWMRETRFKVKERVRQWCFSVVK